MQEYLNTTYKLVRKDNKTRTKSWDQSSEALIKAESHTENDSQHKLC